MFSSIIFIYSCSVDTDELNYDDLLLAYYPIEKGLVLDRTQYRNDFILQSRLTSLGLPKPGMDRFGRDSSAIVFDGIDDSMFAYDQPQLFLNTDFSICFWFLTNERKTQNLIRKGVQIEGVESAPFAISLSQGGDYVFKVSRDTVNVRVRSSSYYLNRWTHLCAISEGVEIRLYVDGNLVTEGKSFGNPTQTFGNLIVGTRTAQYSDSFKGSIDEISIYSRALSETYIKDLTQN